jgi:hypothetical protein
VRDVPQPTKYQKIHWTASKGLNNTGAIRFVKGQQKHTCTVTLTISYEVPQVRLIPYLLCAVSTQLSLARHANRPLTHRLSLLLATRQVLAPVGDALVPFVEGILKKGACCGRSNPCRGRPNRHAAVH